MTLATTFLATALVVPSMPPPEYDDCEVVTNCVFDASRGDAKMFARRKAAFDAYLAVMADTDFSDETNNDRMLPIWATAFLDAVSVMVMRIRTKGGNISRMSGLARRATRPRL